MKNLLTFFCSLLFLLFLSSCEQPPTTAEEPEGTANTKLTASAPPITPPTCNKIGGYEIDSTCASQAMEAWNQVVKNIKAQYTGPDTQFLVRGFAISNAEIDSMQAELHADSTVFGMLAVERVDLGRGQYRDETKIIFLGSSASNPDEYMYFNFTAPCPNTCPKD